MPRPIDRFANCLPHSSSVVLRIAVGPADLAEYYSVETTLIPRPDRWQEDWFVLDSGAMRTFISGGLALDLGLDLTGPIVPIRQVRGYTLARESSLRINIGPDWVELPCWIPWPVEQEKQTENLLGLAGLIGRYDILVSSHEAAFYQRGRLLPRQL